MKRSYVALSVAAAVLAIVLPASAALHEVDIGNYYFEEVATGSRQQVVVNEGDQIRFTVRETTYPTHDVVIDEYGSRYESGPLLLLETFTTPPLDKPGTYALYCRAHRRRGHETTLVVKRSTTPASPQPSSSPKKKTGTTNPAASGSPQPSSTGTASAAPGTAPISGSSPGLAPTGVGVATDRRLASPDANSLAGILGREIGGGEPWTTAVWTWLLAAIPIAGLAAYGVRAELRRR